MDPSKSLKSLKMFFKIATHLKNICTCNWHPPSQNKNRNLRTNSQACRWTRLSYSAGPWSFSFSPMVATTHATVRKIQVFKWTQRGKTSLCFTMCHSHLVPPRHIRQAKASYKAGAKCTSIPQTTSKGGWRNKWDKLSVPWVIAVNHGDSLNDVMKPVSSIIWNFRYCTAYG